MPAPRKPRKSRNTAQHTKKTNIHSSKNSNTIDDDSISDSLNDYIGTKKKYHVKDDLIQPLTAQAIADIMGMDDERVRALLKDMQPDQIVRRTKYWYLRNAVKNLVEPDPKALLTALKNMPADELPPDLNNAFWTAQEKKTRVLVATHQLYSQDKIIEVLSNVIAVFTQGFELHNISIIQKLRNIRNIAEIDNIICDIESNADKTLESMNTELSSFKDVGTSESYGSKNRIGELDDVYEFEQ